MNIINSFRLSQFKFDNIIPIGQVPKPQLATDFRPIAILSATDKIFQRIMAKYKLSITKNI